MALSPGTTLGPYSIHSLLGEGGMGEVYRAHDQRLNRDVAIKVLHPGRLDSEAAQQRFLKEARATSALNHPNIVTIYDIGNQNGLTYLVMELVEGSTLARLIPPGGLPRKRFLAIATQIASAIDKAHRAGILHRDLKPGNIMLTDEGQVKVLDFGLAKILNEGKMASSGADTPTESIVLSTQEGAIVGTAAYMSPEQAEGKPLDSRSDIFSLGAILYEMQSGQRPFRGESQMSTLAAVLREEPTSLMQLRADTPPELDALIRRCLKKDSAKRAASMQDILVSLEDLRDTTAESIQPLLPRRNFLPLAVGAAALAGMVWMGLYWAPPKTADRQYIPTPLNTFPPNLIDPFLSPDGNQMAYTWKGEANDNFDIYVKPLESTTALRLTTHPGADYSATWSPNGQWIAFLREADLPGTVQGRMELIAIPALGGKEIPLGTFYEQRLLVRTRNLAWHPNSQFLLLAASLEPGGPLHLHRIDFATRQATVLARHQRAGGGYVAPSVSPDGKQVLATEVSDQRRIRIWHFQSDSQLGEPHYLDTGGAVPRLAVWTPDGKYFLLETNTNSGLPLFRLPFSGGSPEILYWTGQGVVMPCFSSNGKRLIFFRYRRDTNFYRVSLDGRSDEAPRLIASSNFRETAPMYTADGRSLVFYSNRSATVQIWSSTADGQNARQLTNQHPKATSGTPRPSPDGQSIAFDSDLDGSYQIYVMPASGGVPRQLTKGAESFIAAWSPDSRWIYYSSRETGRLEIWRISRDGGAPEQVTASGGQAPWIPPGGQWLYFTRNDLAPEIWRRPISAAPTDTAGEEKLVDRVYRFNYVATDKALYWVEARSEGAAST